MYGQSYAFDEYGLPSGAAAPLPASSVVRLANSCDSNMRKKHRAADITEITTNFRLIRNFHLFLGNRHDAIAGICQIPHY